MSETPLFPYDANAIDHLSLQDPVLGRYIVERGAIERRMTPDLFEALACSIVSQQISGRASETVCSRMRELLGEITPTAVSNTNGDDIQKCGMSHRKVSYIKAAADAALSGRLPLEAIPHMEDEPIITLLDSLPGIGRWTAEMLLIFSLGRQNVLSYDDLGIRRGLMKLHRLAELSKADFTRYRELYSPYCSVASLYLWDIAAQ